MVLYLLKASVFHPANLSFVFAGLIKTNFILNFKGVVLLKCAFRESGSGFACPPEGSQDFVTYRSV